MSKSVAIVLGTCFVALGAGTLVMALATLDSYGLIVGLLLCITGIASLFYGETSGRKRSH